MGRREEVEVEVEVEESKARQETPKEKRQRKAGIVCPVQGTVPAEPREQSMPCACEGAQTKKKMERRKKGVVLQRKGKEGGHEKRGGKDKPRDM